MLTYCPRACDLCGRNRSDLLIWFIFGLFYSSVLKGADLPNKLLPHRYGIRGIPTVLSRGKLTGGKAESEVKLRRGKTENKLKMNP